MDQAQDIVHILAVNRIPGISLLQHTVHNVFQKLVLSESHHAGPVGHNVPRLGIGKGNDVLDHLRLVLLDDSLFMSLVYHGNDLFLRYRLLLILHGNAEDCRGNAGKPCDKPGNRIKKRNNSIDQANIAERIVPGPVGSDPSEHEDPESRQKDHTDDCHRHKYRKMLYVMVEKSHQRRYQGYAGQYSRSCYDQRNGVDVSLRFVDQLLKKPGFPVALL